MESKSSAELDPATTSCEKQQPEPIKYISVYDKRPAAYNGSCLRPLGLCELGGACDACWYSPDHPRFKSKS